MSKVRSLTPNFTVVVLKMWAYRRQNRQKMVIFGINLLYPLKRFFYTKSGMGRDSQDPTFVPNLIIIPFKMSAYSPQITEIQYKFAEKRYTPLYDFYKIWIGEGVQGPHLHAKFHRSVFKMWAYNLKNREKIAIFWYKFAPNGKFMGSTEKAEYRCTTTNLPLCNDTIIVLKITLLHSVSVITIL